MLQPKMLLVVIVLVSAPFAGCSEDSQTDTPSTSSRQRTTLPPPDGGDTRTASVTRVIDGDTIEVQFEMGKTRFDCLALTRSIREDLLVTHGWDSPGFD